jgi:multidrug efflux pump subunit AcrA (membrane-fusion protein)
VTRGLRNGLEALLLLAVLGGAVVWLSGGCEERVAPHAVDVPGERVAAEGVVPVEAVAGPAVEWASGEVASARHVVVSSRVLARIEALRARAGSSVSEGDVLVVLDARDLAARAGEAEQALRAAEARLELARRDAARAEELFRTGVAARRRLDEARSQLRAARAEVAGAAQALEEARTGASFAEIRSPVGGRVVDRLAEPGDTAVPGRPPAPAPPPPARCAAPACGTRRSRAPARAPAPRAGPGRAARAGARWPPPRPADASVTRPRNRAGRAPARPRAGRSAPPPGPRPPPRRW